MATLTIPQVAARLGLSYQRAWQLVDRGQLPARKVGRDWQVEEADLALVAARPGETPRAARGLPPAGAIRAALDRIRIRALGEDDWLVTVEGDADGLAAARLYRLMAAKGWDGARLGRALWAPTSQEDRRARRNAAAIVARATRGLAES